MYLVDTSVWLELLLEQEHSTETAQFLARLPRERLFVTDFSLHSVAIILVRRGAVEALSAFLRDLADQGRINVIGIAV